MAAAFAFFVSPSAFRSLPPTTQTLEIVTANGVHSFAVELVANDADRAKGLMFRRELPEGRGMLFDFQREQEIAMWMQNTYIPLDMIFINADGRIRRIAENTDAAVDRDHSLRRSRARRARSDRGHGKEVRNQAGGPGRRIRSFRAAKGRARELMRPQIAARESEIVGIGHRPARRVLRLEDLIGDAMVLAIGDRFLL